MLRMWWVNVNRWEEVEMGVQENSLFPLLMTIFSQIQTVRGKFVVSKAIPGRITVVG